MDMEPMSGGTNEAAEIDLTHTPLRLLFSSNALAHSAAANIFRGNSLVFHLKYVPARQGFVVNDRYNGTWGEERFAPISRPEGDEGLLVILSNGPNGLLLSFDGGQEMPLGDRFELTGLVRAAVPSTIGVGERLGSSRISSPARHFPPREVVWEVLDTGQSGFLLRGWADDRVAPIVGFTLLNPTTGARCDIPAYRLHRPDVDPHLPSIIPYEFGIWTAAIKPPRARLAELELSFVTTEGLSLPVQLPRETPKPNPEFVDLLLAHFGGRQLRGEMYTRSIADLNAGYGAILATMHAEMVSTHAIRLEAHFGPRNNACRLSLICVLHGIPDFLYLMVAQFARFGLPDGLEFIFVGNSPELEEVLVRDAELASFVFGARVTLLILNQNSGFAHANNIGVAAATAPMIAIVNPDAYPRTSAAVAHLLILAEEGTGRDVVGGKLHYADGSVMHEGMVFARDMRLSALCGSPAWMIEHLRKGFPDNSRNTPRPVPAVTGALMILSRSTFERVDGFDTDYIYGYYEDADLCLRIRCAGGRALLDPRLAFWHYESMGSMPQPAQAGARLYNRWLFTRRWGAKLERANDV